MMIFYWCSVDFLLKNENSSKRLADLNHSITIEIKHKAAEKLQVNCVIKR